MKKNKLIGIFAVFVGVVIGIAFLVIDKERLVFNDIEFFLARYFLLISMASGSLYFVVYGVLQFIGYIVPYYSENKTDIDNARHGVLSAVLMLPILISGTAAVFLKSESTTWKFFWICFVLYFIYGFWDGLKILTGSRIDRGNSS